MQKETLNNLLLDDKALADLSLADLQRLIEQFPYFQTARILLLKKMKQEEHMAFSRELKNSAVYIGDRAKLYIYLHAFSGGAEMMREALPELSLITTGGDEDKSVSASYSGGGDTTFNYLFFSEEDSEEVVQEDVMSAVEDMAVLDTKPVTGIGEWDLITQFMNSGTKRHIKESADTPTGNLAESSVQENNAVFTETLARIYIKQKKYDQAIGIFKSLSLKNPEKSSYFAARIEELELLLNNS